MLINTFVDLLPFRQVSEYDVLNTYSLNGTGVGGRFVTLETGNQDPALSAGDFAASSPGYAYDHTASLRYEQPRKVKYAPSGAFKNEVVGILLNGTVEHDENGQKVLFHPQIQKEKQIVPSGVTVPIATDGVLTLRAGAYSGTPIPGYVGLVSNGGNGQIQFAPASAANAPYAVCKVLSTSGSAFGGYVQVKLTLK